MNDSKTSSWQFLSADQISRVDAEDLLRAREHIANGVKAAGDEWIPAYVIAEALACELTDLTSSRCSASIVARYLSALAAALTAKGNDRSLN